MKKIYLFLLLNCFGYYTSISQSYIAQTKFNHLQRMAIVNQLPYAADVAKNGIKKKMGELGFNGKEIDGYLAYKNIDIPDIGGGKYNLYFKTERKRKRENEESLVYLLISDSYDAFIDESRDAEVVNKGKAFMNTLNVQVESASIDKEILQHEENVRKAEKRYNNTIDEANDLEKKKRKLEADIEQNKKEQEQRKAEIETQKQLLDAVRNKRKQ